MKKKNNYVAFIGIGAELVGIELTLIYIGHLIDKRMHWPGYALAALSIVGLVVWLGDVVQMLGRLSDDAQDGPQ